MGGVAVGIRAHGPAAVGVQVSHPEPRQRLGRGPRGAPPQSESPWESPSQPETSP
jgi:hypothetical protein